MLSFWQEGDYGLLYQMPNSDLLLQLIQYDPCLMLLSNPDIRDNRKNISVLIDV